MSDIVERLLMAQFRLDDGPEVETMERQAEVDRLAALVRELHEAVHPFAHVGADLGDRPDDGYVLIGESGERLFWRDWRRLSAAVEACEK